MGPHTRGRAQDPTTNRQTRLRRLPFPELADFTPSAPARGAQIQAAFATCAVNDRRSSGWASKCCAHRRTASFVICNPVALISSCARRAYGTGGTDRRRDTIHSARHEPS